MADVLLALPIGRPELPVLLLVAPTEDDSIDIPLPMVVGDKGILCTRRQNCSYWWKHGATQRKGRQASGSAAPRVWSKRGGGGGEKQSVDMDRPFSLQSRSGSSRSTKLSIAPPPSSTTPGKHVAF